MRIAPMVGWPRGFYDLGPAVPVSIVVLAELGEAADTLALRLMGAGLTWRRGLVDLQRTAPGEVRDALVRRVVELHHDRRAHDPTPSDATDEDQLMKAPPFVEEPERRCRTEGRTEGTWFALSRIVERHHGRSASAGRGGQGARRWDGVSVEGQARAALRGAASLGGRAAAPRT